jgi:hypothetical protein
MALAVSYRMAQKVIAIQNVTNAALPCRSKRSSLFSFCLVREHRHFIPKAYNPISNHPSLGAFCRTLPDVGWRRRPLLRLVTAGSGGPGQPSAGITTGCLQWLDAAGTKAGGSPPDKGSQKRHPLLSRPEATAPGTEKPRWSAAGRAPFAKGARASLKRGQDGRHAALRPLGILSGVNGRPGASRVGNTAPPRRQEQGRFCSPTREPRAMRWLPRRSPQGEGRRRKEQGR